MDQRGKYGPVLARQRPPADPVRPRAPPQPQPAQQHHSPGAGAGPCTHTGSLHGPSSAQQHCGQVMKEYTHIHHCASEYMGVCIQDDIAYGWLDRF